MKEGEDGEKGEDGEEGSWRMDLFVRIFTAQFERI